MMASQTTSNSNDRRHRVRSAQDLIARQKTMVLATSIDHQPWTAAVYYVYVADTFYFFSSPRSKHIESAMRNVRCAGMIHSDSDQWEKIEGLQMIGTVYPVESTTDRLAITARYLKRYAFARGLLKTAQRDGRTMETTVRLYGFHPTEVHYMNNANGLGSREPIDLRK